MNAGRTFGALALVLVSCSEPSSLGEPSAQESSALSERDDPPTNLRADVLSPGDAIVGGTAPATCVAQDYLAELLDALAARGARYVPVGVVRPGPARVGRRREYRSRADGRAQDISAAC